MAFCACWKSVSGGVEDAKGFEGKYPYYKYGGMWKDRSADGPISAKKPRKVKERQKEEMKKRESAKDEVEVQESTEDGSSE
ncbi:hypothetical protein E4T44_09778 [Aureobasidium sp. EXF-8845]|nr:hypothetical protein E4T44_09778 [Aureobasidium sp. EXF-8845]KAI4839160.1 hypothetical protein E4T45_09660 [Aureobasidium sp. EXF-8846]